MTLGMLVVGMLIFVGDLSDQIGQRLATLEALLCSLAGALLLARAAQAQPCAVHQGVDGVDAA